MKAGLQACPERKIMITTTRKMVRASTKEYRTGRNCDLCGRKMPLYKQTDFEIEEAAIMYESGSSYPGGGNIEIQRVDICGSCFFSKVKPWVESQGAKFRDEEENWQA